MECLVLFFLILKKNLIFARDRFGIKPYIFILVIIEHFLLRDKTNFVSLGSKNLNENTMLDFF